MNPPVQTSTPRFVVLHHSPVTPTDGRAEHFDWMFQVGDTLRTWATEPLTSFAEPLELAARQLPDHRLHYLEYEGEISKGRGSVRRILAGTFDLLQETETSFQARIHWQDSSQQKHSRLIAIQRNLIPSRLIDETRDDWDLRLESCR